MIWSALSSEYISVPRSSCFWLLRQAALVAFSLARARAGRSSEARIAMIAITTSSSIKVKAVRTEARNWLIFMGPGGVGWLQLNRARGRRKAIYGE